MLNVEPKSRNHTYRPTTPNSFTHSYMYAVWTYLHLAIFANSKGFLVFSGTMDPSVLATMDRDALKKQIENMKYQASMERWPLSKSIAA